MKFAPRAVLSMLMLSGVFVLAVAGLLAVFVALVLAASTGGIWAILAAIAVAVMIVLVGLGLPAARRRQRKPVEGVLISGDEQPLLWVEICIVAEGLHMWPPSQLVLAPDASVVASENRTWLGLRPGVRRLQLGEVLLAGLTERQLRAVIAQELLRFWGPSSSARAIYGGRKFIGRVVDLVGDESRAGRIVGRFGRLYLAVSDPVIARNELDQDTHSANLVGNGATTAALHEVAVLRRGWDAFVEGYLDPALAAQRRPADVFASFAEFLEYPERRAQLAKAIGVPSVQPRSTYNSHPSLADRLSAVASLPEDNTQDRSGRAHDMLREPDRVVNHVHEWMFQDRDLTTATWEEIVPASGRAAARESARKLVRLAQEGGLGPKLSVATQLDIIRYGLAEEMVRPLLDEGSPREVERQLASQLVTAFLATVAIEAGTASYRFSWATPSQLVNDEGKAEDLPALVDAALSDEAALVALELWLRTHKVGGDVALGDNEGPDMKQDTAEGPPESLSVDPAESLPAGLAEELPAARQPILVPQKVH
ncbi:MAG: hypothetical protein ABI899_03450 [Actinomycetota bacterium]